MPHSLPPAVPCSWERAAYEMVGEPASTVTAVPLPPQREWGSPDLALRFRDGRSGQVRWYFGDGGAATQQHLVSINDPGVTGWQPPDPDSRTGRPGGDLIVAGYSARLTAVDAVAQRGKQAPAYLVVPEIADVFRAAGDRPSNTLFRLSACARR